MDFAVFIDGPEDYHGKKIKPYLRIWGSNTNGLQDVYKNCLDIFPKDAEITHLYFGSEFCEYRLPLPGKIREILTLCEKEKIIPVFVTPPVSEYGIKYLEDNMDNVFSFGKDIEVVVNDLGVLEYIYSYYPDVSLAIGRLFDKTSHDPRILSQDIELYYGVEGIKFAQTPGILSYYYLKTLSRYHINRYEFDFPKVGLSVNGEFNYSLYWPYQYLTTGRVCMFRAIQYRGREKFLTGGEKCSEPCRMLKAELRKPVNGFVVENGRKIDNMYLFQKGNTLFYLNESRDIFMGNTTFDRLIIQI